MLGVIFWEVLGLLVLGLTLYLLAVAKTGTVIDNDGIQLTVRTRDGNIWYLPVAQTDGSHPYIAIGSRVVVMSAKTTRWKDTYVLMPKWRLLLAGLATALLFLIMGVYVYTERFLFLFL